MFRSIAGDYRLVCVDVRFAFNGAGHCLLLAGVLLALMSSPATAWWNHGHAHMTEGAIAHLPEPLRGFFEGNLDYVRERAASEPLGKHYINIDVYPEFLAGEFPRELEDLVFIYGENHVAQYGMGPWTYVDYVEELTDQMAVATSESDWFQLLATAAAQAHYIEDLHNPLHLTLNYNGQRTGNGGIHARYEGQMVFLHLDEMSYVATPAVYLPSVLDDVFDGIDAHYPLVAEIMAADDLSNGLSFDDYYESMWSETGEFTQVLFQQASEAVANSWYTAWVDAGSPTSFLGETADFDLDDDVDGADFLTWQRGVANGSVLEDGDANHDSSVDSLDLDIWRNQYISGADAAHIALQVPEPSAVFTCLIVSLVLLAVRQH